MRDSDLVRTARGRNHAWIERAHNEWGWILCGWDGESESYWKTEHMPRAAAEEALATWNALNVNIAESAAYQMASA